MTLLANPKLLYFCCYDNSGKYGIWTETVAIRVSFCKDHYTFMGFIYFLFIFYCIYFLAKRTLTYNSLQFPAEMNTADSKNLIYMITWADYSLRLTVF